MTVIVEGGNPGSAYVGAEQDWDAADVSLQVEPYVGESDASVAAIEVEASALTPRAHGIRAIGVYVEMTRNEVIDLVNTLNRIIG